MPFVPPLILTKRLIKGAKITPAEEDKNMTDIENAANGLAAQLAVALNPDGSLKVNSVSTLSIQNRAVTLAKLAFLSNFYGIDDGSVNAMHIAFDPPDDPLGSYSQGLVFYVKAVASNTGAATLAVDSMPPLGVKKYGSGGLSDLVAGDVIAGGVYIVTHDGTWFILENPTPQRSIYGPVFLDTVQDVYTGVSIAYTDFDASPYIPVGSKAVILQGEARWNDSSSGETRTEMRKDGGSPDLLVCRAAGTDAVACGCQGIFPVQPSLHFEYRITGAHSDGKITIIGYVL